MALLREDLDGLGVLLSDAAAWLSHRAGVNILPTVVEKDFWVTETLRLLSIPQRFDAPSDDAYPVTVRAVFKGGTSLSKAFGIIERFSEDIDVFLAVDPVCGSQPTSRRNCREPPPFHLGAGRVDAIMKATAARVALQLDVPHEPYGASRRGTKRAYALLYPEAVDRATYAAGGLKEGVRLELVRMGTPTPNAAHTLTSMLADYVAAEGLVPLSEFEELAPFTMDVLAPERTLVDKLCILHDVASRTLTGESSRLAGQARHYYDVHQLLNTPAVIQSLEAATDLVATYAAAAEQDSIAVRRPGTARPAAGFASSPAFCDESLLRSARTEYQREMSRLRMGDYPSLDEVVASVQGAAHLL